MGSEQHNDGQLCYWGNHGDMTVTASRESSLYVCESVCRRPNSGARQRFIPGVLVYSCRDKSNRYTSVCSALDGSVVRCKNKQQTDHCDLFLKLDFSLCMILLSQGTGCDLKFIQYTWAV